MSGRPVTEPRCPLGYRDARCGRFGERGPCGCEPPELEVTVCGLPDDTPPEVLRALADLARAARDAFGEPDDAVTVFVSDGPCEEQP